MMRKCFGFLKKTVIAVEQNLRFLFVELLPKERKKRKDILHPKVQPKYFSVCFSKLLKVSYTIFNYFLMW